MKKILCIVTYTYLPAVTGGQKAIASLYENLSNGFDVICIGTKQNDATKASYRMMNYFSASPLRYINIFNFFSIKSIIKKEKADYLQIEHPYIGWLAILLKISTGVRLIVRSHNIEGLRFKNLNKWWWRLLLKYEGWVHRNADINYFITEEDRCYAIKNFGIPELKAHTITFGITQTNKPNQEERDVAEQFLRQSHNLAKDDVIILFNGAFDYKPNLNALTHLTENIFPLLKTISSKRFKLIICGKNIPEVIVNNTTNTDIIFAGFVPDINTYLRGATVFANPVTEGGGIKTKLVEALALNLNCVAYKTGAIGVSKELCGEKLLVVENNEATSFANAIVMASEITTDIPGSFYDHFSNNMILEKIKDIL